MKKLSRRSGFTLPEILVTVTVIAVLAAVIVPTVLQYATKGDAPSALTEIEAVKKGIVSFTSDLRHYPRTLNQLVVTPTTGTTAASSTDMDLANIAYTATDVGAWKGPYFEGGIADTTTVYSLKALGLKFNNTLLKCGAGNAFICVALNGTYTSATLDDLDKKIDGGVGTAATDAAAGNLIWSTPATPTNIYYKLGVAN